jgi:hypothetical protein
VYFDHRQAYRASIRLLKTILWRPHPTEMFKARSKAKSSALYRVAAVHDASKIQELMESALLAARIEHFIAIGGEKARGYFLGDHCLLDAQKIARFVSVNECTHESD